MKNLRFIIWIIALFSILPITSMSSPVNIKKAELLSKKFYSQKTSQKSNIVLYDIVKNQTDTLFYIFNSVDKKGFVIISADDDSYPILAYSSVGNFYYNNIAQATKDFLSDYKKQIIEIKAKGLKANPNIKKSWIQLESNSTKYSDGVEPLLTTRWSQSRYYNEDCPEDVNGINGHVPVGCVATAMAQIMKYHNHPEHGVGSHSYYDYPYGTLTADFGNSTYDWASMPDWLTTYNNAVAQLGFHCGVSVNMNYAYNGSGAYTYKVEYALETYFDYSTSARRVDKYSYTTEDWEDLMRIELDNSRPIQYRGTGSYGGHSFVLDGYEHPDNYFFHVNWGWGGGGNGYYYLSNLNPGGYNFNSGQYAVIGIEPNNIVNHNPIVINDLPYLVFDEGFGFYYIDISDVFYDSDVDDTLNYTVSAYDTLVVFPSLNENILTLSERGFGNTSVTIVADDGNGGTVHNTFVITINHVNQRPVVNHQPNLSLIEGFGTYDIDLTEVFYDPDGDELIYGIYSTNINVINPSVSGDILTLNEGGDLGYVFMILLVFDNNNGFNYDLFWVAVSDGNKSNITLLDLDIDETFEGYTLNELNDIIKKLSPSNKLSEIEIFPNPTNGLVNISKLNPNEITYISVYDISGKIILNNQYENNEHINLNLLDVERGVYVIKIHTNEIDMFRKILVK